MYFGRSFISSAASRHPPRTSSVLSTVIWLITWRPTDLLRRGRTADDRLTLNDLDVLTHSPRDKYLLLSCCAVRDGKAASARYGRRCCQWTRSTENPSVRSELRGKAIWNQKDRGTDRSVCGLKSPTVTTAPVVGDRKIPSDTQHTGSQVMQQTSLSRFRRQIYVTILTSHRHRRCRLRVKTSLFHRSYHYKYWCWSSSSLLFRSH